tara:strand:+ start:14116 stop:14256 length:141 start_codon:yes stop_codon:yes gene_type:complete
MAKMKHLLYLRYTLHLSIEDISSELGIDERTLKKLFHRYEKENKNG